MYIKNLIYENVGPIQYVNITFPFSDNGNPRPILFVGENGSGKSTILSNIVDSFYEIAGKAFDDATKLNDNYQGHQYYKALNPVEIMSGKDYMYSYLGFASNTPFLYISKCGKLSIDEIKEKINSDEIKKLKKNESENFKHISIEKKEAEQQLDNNILCYFGPDRYEKPVWMGEKYYKVEDILHPTVQKRWNRHIVNPIAIKDVVSTNLQWLLDVIVDSRPDISENNGNLSITHININTFLTVKKTRENLENIMSAVLGTKIYFKLDLRNSNNSRFSIVRESDNLVIAPSLDSLSTGQIALFNIFATIVRYADNNRLYNSIKLSDISGIVVIDEVELHLHTKLQRDVLPELLKMFPKVQFIITTHAPLFLLGMQEIFGDENFEIFEMPSATKINVERFSEFQRAYEYLKQTQTYQEEVQHALTESKSKSKTIIVTEGATDWKHIKAAYNSLKNKEEYVELFSGLEFEFFEYEPKNSTNESEYKIEMGASALVALCDNLSKLPQDKKYILIADRDDDYANKKLNCGDGQYTRWSNNVYSAFIPLPDFRKETPKICIEHLYSDEEIKTEVEINGVPRRLYMGNEFNEYGYALDSDRFCERKDICGHNKINIIEGSQGDKVLSIKKPKEVDNYALPKMKFANYVTENPDKFNFDNFLEIFKIIKEIINDDSQEIPNK